MIAAPDTNSDSFFIQLGGGAQRKWFTGQQPGWGWSSNSPTLQAQASVQSLTLHAREDGIKVSDLVLEEGAGVCAFMPPPPSPPPRDQSQTVTSQAFGC